MSAHTPGPWDWISRDGSPRELRAPSSDGSARPEYVLSVDCSISDYGLSVDTSIEVSDANARLIAAAPELLERLVEACEIIRDLSRYANNHGGMLDEEEFVEGLATIAKATNPA